MNRAKKRQDSVTLRPKGNTNPSLEAGNLVDEHEMKALARKIDAGEADPDRTLDNLKAKTEAGLEKKSDGGGRGSQIYGASLEY
jgi:hypothetical protein